MMETDVFDALYRHIQELPQRPIFVCAGDFAQLESVSGDPTVKLACELLASQFVLHTVHRSKDPKHLEFVSLIRDSQPSR